MEDHPLDRPGRRQLGPDVVKQLNDAGIEIETGTDALVNDLSLDVESRADNRKPTLAEIYRHADQAGAYNLASDIARYAVLAKQGGVYADVDIAPGSVDLNAMGDIRMRQDDVPLFAPRLRDETSVRDELGLGKNDPISPEQVSEAADKRYDKGSLNNNFIVAPPSSNFIRSFADTIPQKYTSLKNQMPPQTFDSQLKNLASDISGPTVLNDSPVPWMKPSEGLMGRYTMDNSDLGFQPFENGPLKPLVQPTDFNALFDPTVKDQWSGLQWVTDLSSDQLDTPAVPSTDPGPSSRPAPQPTTTPDPNPAPPNTDAPPQSRDVSNDESWRHSTESNADWFTPDNPQPSSQWDSVRDKAPVRTVDTEVADVQRSSTPGSIDSITGLIKHDVRRMEVAPGQWVKEYTLKVHLNPADGVSPSTVDEVRNRATEGVDRLLNNGYRLPSGDQFHARVEFVTDPAQAHTSVNVSTNPNADQLNWSTSSSANVLAHEVAHYFGLPDEYKDAAGPDARIFNSDGKPLPAGHTQSNLVVQDNGLMGAGVDADPALKPRHLWQIERTTSSQVMVPDADHATLHNPDSPRQSPPPRLPDHGTRPDTDVRSFGPPPPPPPPAPTTTSQSAPPPPPPPPGNQNLAPNNQGAPPNHQGAPPPPPPPGGPSAQQNAGPPPPHPPVVSRRSRTPARPSHRPRSPRA
ncbi:glycosyltransferase [Actinosynnema sp. CA-248983]